MIAKGDELDWVEPSRTPGANGCPSWCADHRMSRGHEPTHELVVRDLLKGGEVVVSQEPGGDPMIVVDFYDFTVAEAREMAEALLEAVVIAETA